MTEIKAMKMPKEQRSSREYAGLYIHIPFCVKKCNYCAFLSFNADNEVRRQYANALMREIELAGNWYSTAETGERRKVDTVYFGGGTPSILDVSDMSRIIKQIHRSFDIAPDAEITIEANPGTLGIKDRVVRAKLTAYRYMGINRLSMGVQSMDNDRLSFLGRIHTAEDVERDFKIARETGFDNINLDLIFSVPGETMEDALGDAEKIVRLGPEHISCYSLQLEEGTPFYEMAETGKIAEVSDEEDRETYHEICSFLKAEGYEHYEISNFAKAGRRSRHNSKYWDMSDYIGLGLGASGFADGMRYRNHDSIREYEDAALQGRLPVMEEHENSDFDNISEAVFTGLRRCEGIRYSELGCDEEAFWDAFPGAREEAEEFERQGLLIIDNEGLKLTEKGIDISNTIMACFV